MSLPLALLVAGVLHVTPYAPVPPPVAAHLLWVAPDGELPTIKAAPPDEAEIVFYFAEPSSDLVTTPTISTADPDFGGMECPLHATMRSFGRWLLVLLSMVLVAAMLGSVGAARRPLPLAAIAVRHPSRPVPLVERLLVLTCLWSPMLMLLGLLQTEREMLSSVLLCMSAVGAISAAVMLVARRRLAARVRWAIEGRLGPLADDGPTTVRAEVEPKKLVPPPGAAGPLPWYRADLMVSAPEGEAARVSLEGLLVDDEAARALTRMAMGLPGSTSLTVVGRAERAPADAASAQPLERHAPTQARIVSGPSGKALLTGGSPAALMRRLRSESLVLGLALTISSLAALLTLL